MFFLPFKLYNCIQNFLVTSYIYIDFTWSVSYKFEVQKLAYMLILAAVVNVPYLSTVGGTLDK